MNFVPPESHGLSLEATALILGVELREIEEGVRSGEIPAIRFGRDGDRLISRSWVRGVVGWGAAGGHE